MDSKERGTSGRGGRKGATRRRKDSRGRWDASVTVAPVVGEQPLSAHSLWLECLNATGESCTCLLVATVIASATRQNMTSWDRKVGAGTAVSVSRPSHTMFNKSPTTSEQLC